jgi:hypothetical protein
MTLDVGENTVAPGESLGLFCSRRRYNFYKIYF